MRVRAIQTQILENIEKPSRLMVRIPRTYRLDYREQIQRVD